MFVVLFVSLRVDRYITLRVTHAGQDVATLLQLRSESLFALHMNSTFEQLCRAGSTMSLTATERHPYSARLGDFEKSG